MVTDAAAGGTDIGPAGHLADRSQAAMSALGHKRTFRSAKSCPLYPQKRTLISGSGCPLCANSGHSQPSNTHSKTASQRSPKLQKVF